MWFVCADGDYEGKGLTLAMHHCELTGHTLTRIDQFGNTMTIERDTEDDE